MHQEKTFLLNAHHIITLLVHISSIQFADQTNQSNKHQLKSELNFIRLPKRLIVCKTTKWVYWKYNIENLFNKYILSVTVRLYILPNIDPGSGGRLYRHMHTLLNTFN